MLNFLSRCLLFVKVKKFHQEPQSVSLFGLRFEVLGGTFTAYPLCGYCVMVFVYIIAFFFSVSIMFFAKKSGFSYTEYAAFCHPLSCQESFDFIFGNLEAYCQGVEDEQTRDAAREF